MKLKLSMVPPLLIVVLTSIGMVLLYAIHQSVTRAQLIEIEQHHVESTLLGEHSQLQLYLMKQAEASLKNWVSLKSESPHILAALIIDPQQKIRAAHQIALEGNDLNSYNAALAAELVKHPPQQGVQPLPLPSHRDELMISLPLQFSDGQGWVLLHYDMRPALASGLRITLQNMLVYLLSMLLSGFLIYVLLRSNLLERLRRLETVLRQYSDGQHQARAEVDQSTEFGQLESMLNYTLDTLDQQQMLRRDNELFNQLVLDSTTDGIISVDIHGHILQVNQSALSIFGYAQPEELVGQDLNLLIPARFRQRHQDHFSEVNKTQTPEHALNKLRQIEGQRKNGSLVPLEINLSKAEWKGSTIYIGFVKDYSEQRYYQTSIENLAFKDKLTACANLNGLKRQAATRQDLSWLYLLNIDGMANLNHSFGFDIGDQLIKASSELFNLHKPTDDLLARYEGADLLILSSQNPEQMLPLLNRLQRKNIKIGGFNIELSFCVVYLEVTPNRDFDQQLHSAELMMRQAKQRGRASVMQVEPGLVQQLQYNALMCQQLDDAIRQQKLFFHYQPKFSALSRAPIGAEALIRWQHDGRMISPGFFIPLAEKSHLMPELDRYVISSACRQIRQWMDQGYQVLPLSINLSAHYLTDEDTINFIFQKVGEFDIPAHLLEIEVTEYSLLQDEQRSADNMFRLQKAGIGIAIDDYGTGHSNLATVLSLPVQNLKIDQSFIRKGMSNAKGRAILENILQLAKSLQVTTTAEGVETEEQLTYLQQSGCDFIQGYLLSKPLPLAEFEGVMKNVIEDLTHSQ